MSKEQKTIADYTKALEKLGKEVKPGTRLAQLKAAHTRAVKASAGSAAQSNSATDSATDKCKSQLRREAITKSKVPAVMPKYEGKQVVRILGIGHTKTHNHCEVKDGVTTIHMHVPKKLFS